MAVIVLAIVVAGFGFNRIIYFDEMSVPRATVWLHALTALGWCSLVVLQTHLIGRAKPQLHRLFGFFGVALLLVTFPVGLLVIHEGYQRLSETGNSEAAIANATAQGIDMVTFPLMAALGILLRGKAAVHKRFMLASVIFMSQPAIFRLISILKLHPLFVMGSMLALIGAMIAHDRRTLGHIHWVTSLVLSTFIASTAVKMWLFNV